jgi:hypothetical protein
LRYPLGIQFARQLIAVQHPINYLIHMKLQYLVHCNSRSAPSAFNAIKLNFCRICQDNGLAHDGLPGRARSALDRSRIAWCAGLRVNFGRRSPGSGGQYCRPNDNLNTHKKNEHWLNAHPNVQFHFTPTSASWLNQVEVWFSILQGAVA